MGFWSWAANTGPGKFVSAIANQGNVGNNARRDEARTGINTNSSQSSEFADQAQGNYANAGNQLQGTYGQLGDAMNHLGGVMRGDNSVSAEQLRQGLQQNLAAQRSYAASASPNNAAMAARTGAMQMGRMGAGMSGQQALAGIQERNAAAGQYGQLGQALGQLQLGARGQDANAALGARQNAIGGYGTVLNGQANESWMDRNKGMVQGVGGALMAMSDERLKEDVENGDDKAARALKGLQTYSFKYKDEKHGKGAQLGVMAQALEDAGLAHTVVDTPAGKAVHGAKAATTALGLVAALGRRVEKLEGR